MFCVNCGKPIENHFKFCPYCATNISTGTQPSSKNADFEIVAGKLIKYTGSSVDVVIPNNVIEIGEKVFASLTPLKSVIIPDSVKVIGNEAFYGCTNLIEVAIPNSVKTIGNNAFSGCNSLMNIIIPNSVTTIGYRAFAECAAFTNITIPYGVTTIGGCAFDGCANLNTITIPDSVTTFGEDGNPVFYGCKSLINIKYPKHFSFVDFKGTPLYEEGMKREKAEWRLANGLCPKCGRKLSFFGNKCNYCNIKY